MAKQAVKTIFIFCLLGLFLPEVPFLHAQTEGKASENEVFAIGTGVIVSGNLARAKESAVSQALTRGLENYLVRRLGKQGVANNFQRLIQEIIPRAEEDIENFHILAEDQIGAKWKVFVRLRINGKFLNEKLRQAGIVFTEGPPIKLLFLVSETRGGKVSCWWRDPETRSALSPTELALHSLFQERGFRPINRVLSVPEAEYTEDMLSADLQEIGILKWGTLFSADVVIYGQAEVIEEKEVSISLEAFDVSQGARICQDVLSEPVEGPEGRERIIETIDRAVRLLAARLTPIIIQVSASDQETINRIEITVKGLSSFKQFRLLRDFLRRDIAGVKSVRQTRIRKDSISIAVEFKGDKYELLDRVLNHENLPLEINLHQIADNKILLTVF
ncbi:MAG: DUF2066 domain-containing protein [Deltaproteobacteria bacterium]|nr:DUF2066 domain-containing protein [Deltaproteobacteria bacterium]